MGHGKTGMYRIITHLGLGLERPCPLLVGVTYAVRQRLMAVTRAAAAAASVSVTHPGGGGTLISFTGPLNNLDVP